MAIGIVGRKAGMTRIFTEDGQAVSVTVIEVEPNRITQLKTLESPFPSPWPLIPGRLLHKLSPLPWWTSWGNRLF